jgi:ABC-type nitrate/sulfonate/bicarbonate transport system substrate-binding protein
MNKRNLIVTLSLLLAVSIGFLIACNPIAQQSNNSQSNPQKALTKVRFGVSPFQDTLVPIVGGEKGWYKEEGLDVEFSVLGWTEVMEALSAGSVDVAINNISSVVATHQQNPNIIYYYGLNPFDNGFALMIRSDGKLKTLPQMMQQYPDRETAIKMTAAQLKGKTVVTTGKTDMEQGVAAAARKGGLDFKKDIKIIDLNPDEGLAAFLRGEGDAYIGGIPQRTKASKEGMIEMLTGADLGPPPINGLVTTKQYAEAHQEELLKILRVWFKTVKYINSNMDDGASVIIKKMNASSGGNFTIEDFKKFWNNYESYPASPKEVQQMILDPKGKNYWQARFNDCNTYFYEITGTIKQPVKAEDAFWMEKAQRAYTEKYGLE